MPHQSKKFGLFFKDNHQGFYVLIFFLAFSRFIVICIHICVSVYSGPQVPAEARRGHWI